MEVYVLGGCCVWYITNYSPLGDVTSNGTSAYAYVFIKPSHSHGGGERCLFLYCSLI